MCIFVVAVLLFLGSDRYGDFCSISVVFQDSVQLVGVDWVFWLAVGLAHQVVQELLN